MLRPESGFLCIYGQRTNMCVGHLYELQRSTAASNKSRIWCRETIVNHILPCSQDQTVFEISMYTVLFGSFSQMQRWKVPSRRLATCLKRISSSLCDGLYVNQVSSTLFGHRWFLRMLLTVARVEVISLLHPSRAVIGNGAEPVLLHYLWLKARGKHLPEALCFCSKVTLINWERGRILHLAERSGPWVRKFAINT